jgi:predicted ATPase
MPSLVIVERLVAVAAPLWIGVVARYSLGSICRVLDICLQRTKPTGIISIHDELQS